MKIIALILSVLSLSQNVSAQFTDDFSDGDFLANPSWQGSTSEFTINPSEFLQLNNSGIAATSYLSAPNNLASLDSVEWRFYVKQAFSGSANNNGRVYLVSDQANLTGPLNGYYLRFGEAGSTDAVTLYEQTGSTSTVVCVATPGAISNAFEIQVQVLRNHLGNWELWIDYSAGNNFVLEATGNNTTHTSSAHIGVVCTYTSSNSTDFFFDDFYAGDYILDITAPSVSSVTALSTTNVDVLFSESIDPVTAQNILNYTINNNIGSPLSATIDGVNASLIHLVLNTALTNGTSYTLTASNINDVAGNTLTNSISPFSYIIFGTPNPKDVIINEIFADPSPQIGLPNSEYIELYNNSNAYFNLAGWTISDGTSNAVLNSYSLMPQEHVILCNISDTAFFSSFGQTHGVNGFPSLNNSGDNLSLTDGSILVDNVNYLDSWYRDGVKEAGGYSLELINPTIPCSDPSNWIASESITGGTPGSQNSLANLLPDINSPEVLDVFVVGNDSIKVLFSEGLDATALGSLVLTFSNGIGYLEALDPNNPACLWINTSTPLQPGDNFMISISGLTDCSGNIMTPDTRPVIVPEIASFNDLVINEVLYDPFSGESDFVELYNRSDKAINIEGYRLANYENSSVGNFALVSDNTYILSPKSFVILTRDSTSIKSVYPLYAKGTFIQMSSMPNYNNDSSTVYLISPDSIVIDRFAYTKDLHFALLTETEGVSLERLDPNRPTNDNSNWHSAAESVGYATPGYSNSQLQIPQNEGLSNDVTVSPEVFSPDNDGFEDVLNINYHFDDAGYVASVSIFDAHGRLLRQLKENELLGSSGIFSWDGTTDGFEKAPIGTYILFFEVYNLSGTVSSFKKICVLASKL